MTGMDLPPGQIGNPALPGNSGFGNAGHLVPVTGGMTGPWYGFGACGQVQGGAWLIFLNIDNGLTGFSWAGNMQP